MPKSPEQVQYTTQRKSSATSKQAGHTDKATVRPPASLRPDNFAPVRPVHANDNRLIYAVDGVSKDQPEFVLNEKHPQVSLVTCDV